MTNRQIAETIIGQIRATDRSALMAWGAKKFVALQEERLQFPGNGIMEEKFQLGGLQFDMNGAKIRGRVLVRLMANDTYTVEVGKVSRTKNKELGCFVPTWKSLALIEDVYCDNLMEVIDHTLER